MPVQKPTFAIIPAATSQKSLGRLTSYGRHVPYGPSPASVLPVCNVPNLNRHVMQGVKAGLTDFHVVEHYMTGHIINVMSYGERFSQGQDVEVRVHHLVNREPLDTAQAMRAVIEEQDFPREQCFFVIGSNIAFSEINLKGMVDGFIAAKQTHKSLVGSLGFVLRPASAVINRYGTAILDENNLIEKFIEKPRSNEEVEEIYRENLERNRLVREASEKLGEPHLPVNTSIYLLLRDIINLAPDSELTNLSRDIFPQFGSGVLHANFFNEEISSGKIRLIRKRWSPLDMAKEYWLAQWRLMNTAPSLIPGNFNKDMHSWVGRETVLEGDPVIFNSVIGARSYIGPGSIIKNSIIGPGSKIQATEIEGSVILPFSYINVKGFAGRITCIWNSVVGGKVIGGTFVDTSTYPHHILDGHLAAPNEQGNIEATALGLTEEDLAEMRLRPEAVEPKEAKDVGELMPDQSFEDLTSLTSKHPLEISAFLNHPWYKDRAGKKNITSLEALAEVTDVEGSMVYRTRIEGEKVKIQVMSQSRRGTAHNYESRAENEIEATDVKRRIVLGNKVWAAYKGLGDFSCVLINNRKPASEEGELVLLLVKYNEKIATDRKSSQLKEKLAAVTEYAAADGIEEADIQKMRDEFAKLTWQYLFENSATTIKDELMKRLKLKPKAK